MTSIHNSDLSMQIWGTLYVKMQIFKPSCSAVNGLTEGAANI